MRFDHNFYIFLLLVLVVMSCMQIANACILVADDEMSLCLVT